MNTTIPEIEEHQNLIREYDKGLVDRHIFMVRSTELMNKINENIRNMLDKKRENLLRLEIEMEKDKMPLPKSKIYNELRMLIKETEEFVKKMKKVKIETYRRYWEQKK